ncbi:MAG: putative ATP-dependent RNA helicase DHX8 [Streblomastix strix]|uniref:RNA helicase n=1 Tax=Streblomastix strix TaxID=222440 RepID=A0A5J4WZM0_9EUKA|nr:MAG: putative ATP-dependent RNA helicase DHX8 [Streblomastix strix]
MAIRSFLNNQLKLLGDMFICDPIPEFIEDKISSNDNLDSFLLSLSEMGLDISRYKKDFTKIYEIARKMKNQLLKESKNITIIDNNDSDAGTLTQKMKRPRSPDSNRHNQSDIQMKQPRIGSMNDDNMNQSSGSNIINRNRFQIHDQRTKQKTDHEKWDEKQLMSAGILSREEVLGMSKTADDDDDDISNKGRNRLNDGILGDADEEIEDIEIEITENEPAFLRGQTEKSMNLSPLRIIQAPEGSLQRTASNMIQQAKERREIINQQQHELLDSIPKGLDRGWADPLPDSNERLLAAELVGIGMRAYERPEWKVQAFGKVPTFGRISTKSITEQRRSLPIFQLREPLLQAVHDNQMLIVIGETGSGKTTQIPQFLAEAGYALRGKIGCTQPRRVAATSVAKRVSEEYGCILGKEVGYAIRFDDTTSKETLIKYMTDGLLLREILEDRDLKSYSVIMLDEAHERTINTDILFGLCKEACVKRNGDLKLIVTSATMDAGKFSNYFSKCPIFTIPGRNFEVEVFYSKQAEDNYVDSAVATAIEIHFGQEAGDILIFLTGQEEIDQTCSMLFDRMKKLKQGIQAKGSSGIPDLIILPVYSALPSEIQSRVFDAAPPGSRKCVVATNIAEASLTIDGIKFVIDSGFVKQNCYNPRLGMDSLQIVPISKASAKQRTGRAGRTNTGKCFRLYTEAAFRDEMLPNTIPEIQRANLGNTVLLLKAMGINDILAFDFMDPPPRQTLLASLEQLYALEALDEEGLLTRLGRRMAEFPLEPPLAKMLLESEQLGCSEEILTITAMLSVENIFYRPSDKVDEADKSKAKLVRPEGDHITLLYIYNKYEENIRDAAWCRRNFIQKRAMQRAKDVRTHLAELLRKYKVEIISCKQDTNRILKAIVSGFFNHAAKKDPTEGYRTLADNQTVFIHPSSALFQKGAEYVLYHELVLTTKEYMRNVCSIDPRWLLEFAPKYYSRVDPSKPSRAKQRMRIEPLYSKFQDANSWRISKQRVRKN